MPDEHARLEPPVFLLATPQVVDPFFHKSVILLVSHEDSGSAGFIVNRVTESRVAEVLRTMGITWAGGGEDRVFFGGPVQPHLGTVIFDSQEAALPLAEGESQPPPAFQGVRLSRDVTSLSEIAKGPPASFRLLLGYAGWSAGQLVDEILRNDWLIAPLNKAVLFSSSPQEAWESAVRGVGLNPSDLGAWVSPSGQGQVN
ncbi:MAG TPA: YqgE/AlgH family protein [Candidatus Polarisedimenticolia bacterium]|nr:YqgE/AlgH family protein [Candidatus Polarisedimenticolia bacterium]